MSELPRYKCYKEVQAGKIVNVSGTMLTIQVDPDGPIYCLNVGVGIEWLAKHRPVIGGYFVRYEDGYESFSPASAFENGYARV